MGNSLFLRPNPVRPGAPGWEMHYRNLN